LKLTCVGPLLSGDDGSNDDDNVHFDAELIVLIWASVGQTIARIMIPYVARHVGVFITNRMHQKHLDLDPNDVSKLDLLIQLKISNATTLPLTFLIGLIFFVFLLALTFSHSIAFIVASTIISGAYGSMWVVTNTFPLFFPKYDYSVLLSCFQLCGLTGMVIFIGLTSFVFELNNEGMFVALLVVSVVTMVVTAAAMVDRFLTEPADLHYRGNSDSLSVSLLRDSDSRM